MTFIYSYHYGDEFKFTNISMECNPKNIKKIKFKKVRNAYQIYMGASWNDRLEKIRIKTLAFKRQYCDPLRNKFIEDKCKQLKIGLYSQVALAQLLSTFPCVSDSLVDLKSYRFSDNYDNKITLSNKQEITINCKSSKFPEWKTNIGKEDIYCYFHYTQNIQDNEIWELSFLGWLTRTQLQKLKNQKMGTIDMNTIDNLFSPESFEKYLEQLSSK